jgi:hypothetical protein
MISSREPEPKPMKADAGPFEVDFSPIDKSKAMDCKLMITILTEGGARFRETYSQTGGVSASDFASVLETSLGADWKVKREDGKVTITSYKGDRIKSVEVIPVGLDEKSAPTVKRVKPK